MRVDEVAAARYAHGLFRAAEKTELEKVNSDLKSLVDVLKPSGLKSFLENPKYALEDKHNIIDKVSAKLKSRLSSGFLHLLLKKSRVNLIYGIASHFEALVHEAQGIVVADITLVGTPNKVFLDYIHRSLVHFTEKKVHINVHTDPTLVGGIRVKMGHRLIDGSIRSRLDELKKRLLETDIN